ncbi:Aste57867_17983 [Aphanomyces stellatus]|uniref:Aste57867_17983 protein n=1 Tax=Aphanomyces stellatus TaxID=120398 RepID=A0A485L982_9STRA|nr:hypothetical protein As57867_017921 [Aphanomyces stellatus]VFT94722.1 Aste57867_17983 [Aphanomyces stellatus]
MKVLRNAISGSRNRYTQDGFDLDLTYIHDRVMAMGYPATGVEKTYRNDVSDVSSFLNKKHPGKYFIYNLSERHYDGHKFGDRVSECGFPDHHPPPLQILLDILNQMLAWYTADPENVVVVHCMAGKGRTGVVVTCFLIVIGFFEQEYNLSIYHKRDDELLDYVHAVNGIFWKKRGQGVRYPSQTRYVYYFIKYLTSLSHRPERLGFRLPPFPMPCKLFLREIVMSGIPNIDGGGCSPFLLVHPAPSEHVPSKILYNSAWDTRSIQTYPSDSHTQVVFPAECLVEGDFLVRIYHANATLILGKKESQLCHFTVHTDFIAMRPNGVYTLPKSEIDDAEDNKRFPDEFKIDLVFEQVPESRENLSVRNLMPHDVREKEQFIKRGWLFKQGGFVQNWKRRWCVAKDGKLTYYKSEAKLQANGAVSLEGATIDRWQGRDKDMAKMTQPCYFFKVEPPAGGQKKRVYYFGADSEAEMHEWIRVLSAQNTAMPPLALYRSQSVNLRKSGSFVDTDNHSFVSTSSSIHGRSSVSTNNQQGSSFRNSLPSNGGGGTSARRMMSRMSFDDRSQHTHESKKHAPHVPVMSTYEYSTEELLTAADLQQHLKETGQYAEFCAMPRADAIQLVLLLAHDMFPSLLDAVDEDSSHLIDMVAGRESFK